MQMVSQAPILSRTKATDLSACFKTRPAGALVTTATLKLIKTPSLALTPDTTQATLAANEADFNGYAAATPTLSDPYNQGSDYIGPIATATFAMGSGSPANPCTIYGYWLEDGLGAVVVMEVFPDSDGIPIANPGDYVEVSVILPVQMGTQLA